MPPSSGLSRGRPRAGILSCTLIKTYLHAAAIFPSQCICTNTNTNVNTDTNLQIYLQIQMYFNYAAFFSLWHLGELLLFNEFGCLCKGFNMPIFICIYIRICTLDVLCLNAFGCRIEQPICLCKPWQDTTQVMQGMQSGEPKIKVLISNLYLHLYLRMDKYNKNARKLLSLSKQVHSMHTEVLSFEHLHHEEAVERCQSKTNLPY